MKLLTLLFSLAFTCSSYSVTVIAHRGGAENDLPESSIAAFERSIQRGIKVLETDLHLTKDNQVIVYHDPYFVKNKSLAIVDLSYQDSLKVGQEHNFEIVRLKDLADLIASSHQDIKLELEIKYTSPIEAKYAFYKDRSETVHVIMNELRSLDLLNRVTISSFDEEILTMLRREYPSMELKFLYRGVYFGNSIGNPESCKQICFWPNWKKAIDFVKQNKIDVFSPSALLITHPVMQTLRPVPQVLKENYQTGGRLFKISPWTVNKVEDLETLKNLISVDEVITDFPLLFLN